MKRPIPVKIVIFAYSALACLVILASAYATYVGWIAENGTLSAYQAGFIKGMGFDPSLFKFAHSAIFVGALAPTFVLLLICLFCLLKRWVVAFVIVFLLDALLFTSGIGYLFKVVVVVLLLIPSSQKYFKKQEGKGASNSHDEDEPKTSSSSDRTSMPAD